MVGGRDTDRVLQRVLVGVLAACAALTGCGPASRPATDDRMQLAVESAMPRRQVAPSWSIAVEPTFKQEERAEGTVLAARGRTIWVNSWQTPPENDRAQTVAWLKEQSSPDRRDLFEEVDGEVVRLAYLLREVQGGRPRIAVYAYAVGDGGYLQLAMYFQDEKYLDWALRVARSVQAEGGPSDPARGIRP